MQFRAKALRILLAIAGAGAAAAAPAASAATFGASGIVFVDAASPGGGLFTLDLATGTVAPVAGAGDHSYDPAVSPDGTQIAFARGGDLWTIPVRGGTPVRATGSPGVDDYQPAWWPDGDRLMFVSRPSSGDATPLIQIVSLSTRDQAVWWDPGDLVAYPALRADGATAVTRGTGAARAVSVRLPFDPFGTEPEQVIPGPPGSDDASWSPDGRLLAYELDRPGGTVVAVGAPGEAPTPIGGEPLAQPAWSPDGQAILALRRGAGGLVVVTAGPDARWGTSDDVVQPVPGGAGAGRISPSWIPDRSASAPGPTPTPTPPGSAAPSVGGPPVAPAPPTATGMGRIFFSAPGPENVDIYSVSPAGDQPRRLTDNFADDEDPDVAPWVAGREQLVIWTYRSAATTHLRTMRPDGTGSRMYPMRVPRGLRPTDPSWLADASGVVFVGLMRGEPRTSLWIVREGGMAQRLTQPVDAQGQPVTDRFPAVSPDGTQVVFRRTGANGLPSLCVVAITGGAPRCTTDTRYAQVISEELCGDPRFCRDFLSPLLAWLARGIPSWSGQEIWSTAGVVDRGTQIVVDPVTKAPLTLPSYTVYADDREFSRWPFDLPKDLQALVSPLVPIYPRGAAPQTPFYAEPSPDGSRILTLAGWRSGDRSGEQLVITGGLGGTPAFGGPITDRLPQIGIPSWQAVPLSGPAPALGFGARTDVRAERMPTGAIRVTNGEAVGVQVELRRQGASAAARRAAAGCSGAVVQRRFVPAGSRVRFGLGRELAGRRLCLTVRSVAGERRSIALRRSP